MSLSRAAAPLLACAVLFLVLIQPNHPAAMTWGALAVFPLELPVLVALLVLAGNGVTGRVLRAVLVALLSIIALLKLADYASFIAFNRGFNPLVDMNLVSAGWSLVTGTLGDWLALLALAGLFLALAGVVAALWWATGVLARQHRRGWQVVLAGVVLVPALVLTGAQIGQAGRVLSLPDPWRGMIPGSAFTARVAFERVAQWRVTMADLRLFRAEARRDPMLVSPPLLDLPGARDVILIFVESYGRSSFDNPLYAATHRATMERGEAALRPLGLAMRSAWATAPMAGGQSWLAHGTVASGLWLDSNGRYRALLASPRRTLHHFAQDTGRRTVAIKPAHVFPWPEGAYFGFDAIYNAEDLGYRGQPFNWVTMPDQFTLTALDRLERGTPQGAPGRIPLLVQVALVSSHAPWVPIPPLIDWQAIGDGVVFDRWANSGDPPEVVWRDRDRVRDQFRQAIDYSLRTVLSWAERHAPDPPLIIVMGDHQPAGFVSGSESFDVPVHVIGPADLVAPFEALGWTEGLTPSPTLPPVRLDAMRDLLLGALSSRP